MAFKSVTRGGRVYFVPGALPVPVGQRDDVRVARVKGCVAQITYVRDWSTVPLPDPPGAAVASVPPERVARASRISLFDRR